jgi:hypothetical protein
LAQQCADRIGGYPVQKAEPFVRQLAALYEPVDCHFRHPTPVGDFGDCQQSLPAGCAGFTSSSGMTVS